MHNIKKGVNVKSIVLSVERGEVKVKKSKKVKEVKKKK